MKTALVGVLLLLRAIAEPPINDLRSTVLLMLEAGNSKGALR
jgi:hypothetical protein